MDEWHRNVESRADASHYLCWMHLNTKTICLQRQAVGWGIISESSDFTINPPAFIKPSGWAGMLAVQPTGQPRYCSSSVYWSPGVKTISSCYISFSCKNISFKNQRAVFTLNFEQGLKMEITHLHVTSNDEGTPMQRLRQDELWVGMKSSCSDFCLHFAQ